MRGVKPLRLGLVTRMFTFERKHRLGVSGLIFFPLDAPETLFAEVAMWKLSGEALGANAALDEGVPKSRAEVLLAGSAHPPRRPATTCTVRIAVGAWEKRLWVIGDRTWVREVPTSPARFESMPLTWERAFGGEGYAANPVGRGVAPVEVDGVPVHSLPNIELPDHLIRSFKARPPPAGTLPVDQTWPPRAGKAGTYGAEWLDKDYPGLASDIDWRWFNLAPEDQHQRDFFRGGEPIVLENLHPDRPRIDSRVPTHRVRAFVDKGAGLEALEMRATTLWLFPEALRGILVFQGSAIVAEDDGMDVRTIVLGADAIGAPRGIDHYRGALALRDDPEKAIAAVLDDSDLLPPGAAAPDAEELAERALVTPEGRVEARVSKKADAEIEKARELVRSHGLDPDVHGPMVAAPKSPPPSIDDLPRVIEELKAQGAAMQRDAEEKQAERDRAIEAKFEELGLDFDTVRAERTETPRGPPTFTSESKRAEMRRLAEEVRAAGADASELDAYADGPEWVAQWEQAEEQLRAAYRMTAHFQAEVPPRPEAMALELQGDLLARLRDGRAVRGVDFSGAYLGNLDLSGADLSGAYLESAIFERSDLTGANLGGAVLARARFETATLRRADLTGANLGEARLVAADLSECDLTDAILVRAQMHGVSLVGARLERTDLTEANIEQCDLSRALARGVVFLETSFAGVSLIGTDLRESCFLRVSLAGLDLSGANLEGVVFFEVDASGAIFRGAHMREVRFVMGSSLAGADCTGADMSRANLRGVRMAGANLSGVKLGGADLSEADLSDARLYRAQAREATMVRTDLRRAQLVGADLMEAILQKADLRGADLRGSSLYGADLALIRGDAATKLTDSNRKRARVKPLRPPSGEAE